MSDKYSNEPMLDMFIFETSQLIEQLEQSILTSERSRGFTQDAINEIFRIMHTIKGSSAMMMFNDISTLAHSIEDLFYYLRAGKREYMDCSALSDLVLEGIDFIKVEVEKIKNGDAADGNAASLIENIKCFLSKLKQENCAGSSNEPVKDTEPVQSENRQFYISQKKQRIPADVCQNAYKAVIFFEDGCEMENIRAFTIVHKLKDITEEIYHIPQDIIDERSADAIRLNGFQIFCRSNCPYEKMHEFFIQTIYLKDLELTQVENLEEFARLEKEMQLETRAKEGFQELNRYAGIREVSTEKENQSCSMQESIISVNVAKLDKLMDLVGEMVISEAMVVQNPDLKGLELESFRKAARQLHKITSEIQNSVMSIRMVPLSGTFMKMRRILRDMCRKLNKEVELVVIGDETEVDKNVIEHISDPLMHLVRNSIDHGIESPEERSAKDKTRTGTITLEARNAGSDVLVIVKDDGRGLSRDKILKKAGENGLLHKPGEEMSDKEVFNMIFLPGFSTKENVTEFSGRGVGMDVVTKNVEAVGGSVSIDSTPDKGTVITLKIPLTLAIIDGMNIKVGNSRYTVPTISIRESFRPAGNNIITDTEGNEMIMVRGLCYPIIRLHERFGVKTDVTRFCEGIFVMVQQDEKTVCLFADELVGQQQVVVKALPEYVRKFKKTRGLAGCTLLGDGSISLIIDIAKLSGV